MRRFALLRAVVTGFAVLTWAGQALAQPAPNAQPAGGTVAAGSATITQSATVTTIQQATPRASINWQSFDIGSQQTVQFQQPSTSAMALNRVVGPNPSQIAGRIDANGQVIITNQSGVTFYRGAQVNTAGLMVTAAGISDANFMAGRMVFDQAPNPGAAVVNEGRITVRDAGLAALVAPQVANDGVITARLGHVVLAGAQTATLDLYGDGLVAIDVTGQVVQAPNGATALVTNSGLVRADGGTVQLTARAADGVVQTLVNAGGRIQANTVGNRTGTVVLSGIGGNVTVTGQLAATGTAAGTAGGAIAVNGSGTVAVAAGADIDASGQAGGGTIAIGTTLARAAGGPGTPSRHTAANVSVAPGATIAANATGRGNGGRVTVLASQATVMNGAISATGGPLGGNGGIVETSGMQILDVGPTASVTAAAPHGAAGQWLLDPDSNILISDIGTSNVPCISGLCEPTSDSSILAPSVIETSLNAGTSVTVSTTNGNGMQQPGNITVGQNALGIDGEIQLTAAQTVSLTLSAGAGGGAGSITINSPITDTGSGGALTVVLAAPNGGITIANNLTLAGALTATAGTTINLGAGAGTTITTGGGQTYAAAVNLQAATSLVDTGATGILFTRTVDGGQSLTVNAGTGTVDFEGAVGATTPLASLTTQSATVLGGNVTSTGTQTYNGAVSVNATETLSSTAGSVVFGSTVDGSSADEAIGLTVSAANGEATFDGAVGSNIALASLTVTGPTTLGADITTSGAQTYSNPVTLTAPVTLATTGAAIVLDAQVTGGANSLSLVTGGGAATLSGVTTTGNLTVNTQGPPTNFGAIIGPVTLGTGTYTITGGANPYVFGAVTTNGTLTFGQSTSFGKVTLGSATTINSSGVNGAIDFGSTVDGAFGLTVNAGTGTATFTAAVGATTPLTSLAVTGPTTLDANVTTNGPQTYNSAVTVGNSITLNPNANGANGAIVFAGKVDAATADVQTLTLGGGVGGGTGQVIFGGAVGGTKALGALFVTGSGQATLGSNVTTFGAQTYDGPVVLSGAAVLTSTAAGASVDFNNTLNGAFALTVSAGNSVDLGVVGGTTPLASLTVSGPTFLSGNVTTAGAQTYNGTVALVNAVTLNSNFNAAGGAIDFASTVDAAPGTVAGLTLSSGAGAITFSDAVGSAAAVANLTATGGTITLNGNVTVNGAIALDSTVAGSTLSINTTLDAAQIALVSAGPITEGANGVLDPAQLAVNAAGPVSLTGVNNVTDLAADITGSGNGFAFRDVATNLAIDSVTIPSAAVSVTTGITTNNGPIQVATTTSGNVTVDNPISSGGAAIDLAVAPGSAFTTASTITSGNGNIVVIADQVSLLDGTISTGSTSAGTVVLGPATPNLPIVLGQASSTGTFGLQNADFGSITAGMVQVGYRAENGAAFFTGTITIGGSAGLSLSTNNFPALLLVTGGAGTVSQSEPISFPGGTLGTIADANTILTSGNSIGTFAAFTDGGLLSVDNGVALTIGSLPLPTLGIAVNANGLAGSSALPNGNGLPANPLSGITTSGTLVLGDTGGLTLAANVTAPGQTVTIGVNSGGITQTAGTITAGTLTGGATGSIALNDSNAIATVSSFVARDGLSLVDGTNLTVAGAVSGETNTSISSAGTLTVTGSVIDTSAGAISLTGSSIAIANAGLIDDDGGTTSLTATGGTITETGTLLVGTLSGSAAGAATLSGATPFSNQVATLGNFTAGSLTLTDATALTITGPVTADNLTISATGRMVLAGNIATIGAPLSQQSGASPAPQGSTLQVVASATNPSAGTQFVQTGTVTLTDPPATTLRVQLPANGGTASFNSLLGTGANLVLALGSGTATGTVQLGGLLVIGQGGSVTLTGSIGGLTTAAAAALGQITPAVNSSYTFNGCAIGLAACGAVPPTSPGTPSPSVNARVLAASRTAVLGDLANAQLLPGPQLPPVPPPEAANLILLPTPPLLANQFTPQDVVPPNISFEDY